MPTSAYRSSLVEAERVAGLVRATEKAIERREHRTLIGSAVRAVSPVCQSVWVRKVAVLNSDRRRSLADADAGWRQRCRIKQPVDRKVDHDGIGRRTFSRDAQPRARSSGAASSPAPRMPAPSATAAVLRPAARRRTLQGTASRSRSAASPRFLGGCQALARLRTASSSRRWRPAR